MLYKGISAALVLLNAVDVRGQSSLGLAGVISDAASLASALAASSSAASASATASTSTTPTSQSTTLQTSHTASAAATSDPSSNGINPQARTIILAVCIPVGLLLLGALIGCLLCCCIRRRRKHRRAATPEVAEVGRDDWRRGDSAHHGYVSSDSDLNRHPKIPTTASQDSAPLMAETAEKTAPSTSVHPAYRTHSWGSPSNVNSQNPFTPPPPVARKPLPGGHHNGRPALAAGAGAAAGAAALRQHHKKQDEQKYTNPHHPLSSHPTEPSPYTREGELARDFRDPNRPPTPFGLNSFGAEKKNPDYAVVDPVVPTGESEYTSPHNVNYPTEAQRRSLSERDLIGAGQSMAAPEPSLPERSPKRSSFGNSGYLNQYGSARPSFNDNSYTGNDSDTSHESWQSAQGAQNHAQPQAQHPYYEDTQPVRTQARHPYYEDAQHYDPDPRQSEDYSYGDGNRFSNVPLVAPNPVWNDSHRSHRDSSESSSSRIQDSPWRLYGPDGSPRRSIGPDGKPRRLRFSDLQPQEYRYDYDHHDAHTVGQAL